MIIKNSKYKMMINIIIILSIIAIDQISKNIAINSISNLNSYIYINRFLNIVLVKNSGITFGLFNDDNHSNVIFSILTILILLYLLYFLFIKENNIISKISLIMIISGAFGNFIDRLNYGSVIDFIDFHINNHHWYAFNIADSAICIGAFIMLFENLKNDNKYKKI